MKYFLKKNKLVFILLILTSLSLSAQTYDVTDIIFATDSIAMEKGQTTQITCTVLPTYASNKAIKWSVNDLSSASIDNQGNITAYSGGFIIVTVSSESNPGIEKHMYVNILEHVDSISLSLHDTVIVTGTILALIPDLFPKTSYNLDYTIHTSNQNIVYAAYPDYVEAKSPGTAIISVISAENPSISKDITIKVVDRKFNTDELAILNSEGTDLMYSSNNNVNLNKEYLLELYTQLDNANQIIGLSPTDSTIAQAHVDSISVALRKSIINVNCNCNDTTVKYGCTNIASLNYNPLASYSDGSCLFAHESNTYLEIVKPGVILNDTLSTVAIEDCAFNYDLPIDSITVDSVLKISTKKFTAFWAFWQEGSKYTTQSDYTTSNFDGEVYLFLSMYCINGKLKAESNDSIKAITVAKVVNLKSALTYSNIVNELSKSLRIYPLPVTTCLNIAYNSKTTNNVLFSVVSVKGQTIVEKSFKCNQGENVFHIEFEVANGTYYLKSYENGKLTGLIQFIKK